MLVSNHAKETNWGFSNCTCVQIVQYCSFKAEPIFDQQAMFDLLQTVRTNIEAPHTLEPHAFHPSKRFQRRIRHRRSQTSVGIWTYHCDELQQIRRASCRERVCQYV